MEKGTSTLVAELQDHFDREWDMLVKIIDNIPDDEWTKGEQGRVIPVQHAVHLVVGANVFIGDIPLEQFDPTQFMEGAKPGGPWTMAPEELWNRETTLKKLSKMRGIVANLLAQFDDADLLEPEKVHPWTGKTRLGKLLYELRHVQHHLGVLDAELGRRGIQGFERWD